MLTLETLQEMAFDGGPGFADWRGAVKMGLSGYVTAMTAADVSDLAGFVAGELEFVEGELAWPVHLGLTFEDGRLTSFGQSFVLGLASATVDDDFVEADDDFDDDDGDDGSWELDDDDDDDQEGGEF